MIKDPSVDSILNTIYRLQKIFVTDFDLTRTKEGWVFKCSYTLSNHSSRAQAAGLINIPTYIAGTRIVGESLADIVSQVAALEREEVI